MKNIIDNYSRAFLELSVEKKQLEDIFIAVKEFLLKMNEKENNVFYSLPPKIQKEIIEELKIPELFKMMLNEIINSGRSMILEEILADFSDKTQEYLGRVKIELVTSAPESETLIKKIEQIFSGHLKKSVVVESKIDPDIIGGFIINYKNWEYNFSVSNFLQKMKEEF